MIRNSPSSTHRCRSIPTERMLRTICAWDSSNANRIPRSPRSHPASKNLALSDVLPDPGVPESSTLEPRYSRRRRASHQALPPQWESARRWHHVATTSRTPAAPRTRSGRSGTDTRPDRDVTRGTSPPATYGSRSDRARGDRARSRNRTRTPPTDGGSTLAHRARRSRSRSPHDPFSDRNSRRSSARNRS